MTKKRQANQPVNTESSDDDIRARAREIHERGDGELEIDIDAEISRGVGDVEDTAEGTYVQAWVWVDFDA